MVESNLPDSKDSSDPTAQGSGVIGLENLSAKRAPTTTTDVEIPSRKTLKAFEDIKTRKGNQESDNI